jgi:hypothetical protein
MIALDPASTRRYVLRDERGLPPEEQSVFLLRTLSVRELAQIEDRAAGVSHGGEDGEQMIAVRSGSTRLEALRFGLVGWERVFDSKGGEVPFRGTKQKRNGVDFVQPDDETLGRIPPKYRLELAEEITEGSRLTQAERGNSSHSASSASADLPSSTAEDADMTPGSSDDGAARKPRRSR